MRSRMSQMRPPPDAVPAGLSARAGSSRAGCAPGVPGMPTAAARPGVARTCIPLRPVRRHRCRFLTRAARKCRRAPRDSQQRPWHQFCPQQASRRKLCALRSPSLRLLLFGGSLDRVQSRMPARHAWGGSWMRQPMKHTLGLWQVDLVWEASALSPQHGGASFPVLIAMLSARSQPLGRLSTLRYELDVACLHARKTDASAPRDQVPCTPCTTLKIWQFGGALLELKLRPLALAARCLFLFPVVFRRQCFSAQRDSGCA
mmetsp:Transcript_173021/g.420880  ORF Transcript_173021/g.420880 Transcript_173021/m.420880 type:complete len:259 (-) Transcript_173021:141-917(-)